MDTLVLVVFLLVYLGMVLGELPGLAVDRTGVALLGAIALLTAGRLKTNDIAHAIDVPTMALLLGLMVLSAQFRLSGFYSEVVRCVSSTGGAPSRLLALVIAAAGVLSAVLANDIVCLAMAPVLAECCANRRLDPKPFLLGLACASNVGSAATLIGNPQNMLIGQVLQLSFSGYIRVALLPSALGLLVTWAVICWYSRGRWERESKVLAASEIGSFAYCPEAWRLEHGLKAAQITSRAGRKVFHSIAKGRRPSSEAPRLSALHNTSSPLALVSAVR